METLRLGRISHFFRDLVYDTPGFWATTTFFVQRDQHFGRLAEWLDRAKTLPLSLRINTLHRAVEWEEDHDTNSDHVMANLMGVLRPYLSRCIDIDFRLPYPRHYILPQGPGSLPNLRTLTVHLVVGFMGDGLFDTDAMLITAPHLQDVDLFNVWIERIQLPWQNLRSLHLSKIFLMECASTLRSACNIVHLTLGEVYEVSELVFQGFRERPSGPTVIFPNLRTFDCFAQLNDALSSLFKVVAMPSLTTLRIAPPDRKGFNPEAIFPLLRSCRDSLSLVITVNLLDDEILRLWTFLPHVYAR